MSFRDFDIELQKGLPEKIYCIYSAQEFLLFETIKDIKDNFTAKGYIVEEFNLAVADEHISIHELIDLLNTPPFMGSNKIVILNCGEKLSKKDIPIISRYSQNPSPFSTLVICVYLSDKKKGYPLDIKAKISIDITLTSKEIRVWINKKTKQRGFTLTKNALEFLSTYTGDDVGLLYSEVMKFESLGKDIVDVEDIKDLTYAGVSYGAFNLTSVLGSGRVKDTFLTYKRLGENVDDVLLLGAICTNYVNYRARSESTEKIRKTLRILHEADSLLKRSAPAVIESTLLRLLGVV
ncbi:MAG: DNA polymerase III subunit delta [Thermodesulfovibrionales bacterium]